MTTFNRTYRAPKFFLCVHHTEEEHVVFEPAEERFSHFSFISRGGGRLHALVDGKFDSNTSMSVGVKKLFTVKQFINCNVVGELNENTRIIFFNSWHKNDNWEGRLIETGTVSSIQKYAAIVCLEGSCTIDGKEIRELEYANLKPNKEYSVKLSEDSYVGLFELC